MSRNITLAPGKYYHIYNRGTEKRNIFTVKADYDRFLALLYFANGTEPVHIENLKRQQKERGSTLLNVLANDVRGEPLVDICAYCLMPNHFHLLLHEKTDSGISRFMQKIGNGYTGYFNVRHDRNGALFQGKFKATLVDNDNYLSYLISYIHLNPIKLIEPTWKETGIKNKIQAEKYLEHYPYSSYLDYFLNNNRTESIILNKNALPQYSESPIDFKRSITEWLTYNPDSLE